MTRVERLRDLDRLAALRRLHATSSSPPTANTICASCGKILGPALIALTPGESS